MTAFSVVCMNSPVNHVFSFIYKQNLAFWDITATQPLWYKTVEKLVDKWITDTDMGNFRPFSSPFRKNVS